MIRTSRRRPKYRHFKPRDLAVVYFGREAVYLGPFGSYESHHNCEREIAHWRVGQDSGVPRESVTIEMVVPEAVSELIRPHLRHAETYYADARLIIESPSS